MGWFVMSDEEIQLRDDFGLVHADFYIIDPRGLNFRPRVGMGWFVAVPTSMTSMTNFRLRLGLGWFSQEHL